MKLFVRSISAEWLKTRRSAASWLVMGGAFFVPIVFILVSLNANPFDLYHQVLQKGYWTLKYKSEWNTVAVLLMPLGAVLGAALIAQIEYRNNGWKLALVTPQPLAYLYFIKLLVLVARMGQFILLFHLGIYVSSVFPSLFYRGIQYPTTSYPLLELIKQDGLMLIAILPVLALQHMLSILFRNMFIPLAVGIVLWLSSLMVMQWKYVYLIPFAYAPAYFAPFKETFNINLCAVVSFLLFTLTGFLIFRLRKDKS